MSDDRQHRCWRCGYSLQHSAFARDTICPGCRTPTRVCRNCCHYDNSLPNQCREAAAEPIHDKQRANACPCFAPA